jgi:molecular chaperone GrpE (heat shock protein)
MKIKTWLFWILLLLLPGGIGWLTVQTQRSIQTRKIDQSRQVHQQEIREYLKMYESWIALSAEERLENPWGQDPYGGPEIQKKLRENQEERLLSNLPDLLGPSQIPREAADILFGPGWQQVVSDYRDRLEKQEIILVTSSILLVSGGLLTVLFIGRVAIALIGRIGSRPDKQTRAQRRRDIKEKRKKEKARLAKSRRGLQPADRTESPSQAREQTPEEQEQPDAETQTPEPETPSVTQTLGYFETGRRQNRALPEGDSDDAEIQSAISEINRASLALIEETEAAAQPVLQNLMTPEPVARELNELSEQMSAIRQFAADQQTHIRKLQDGYDWLIIKRFCLRIIRCIDNLDDRIAAACSEGQDPAVLRDIRDELLFALESSGVEAFEPESGRQYRGLEKYAEAVKDRIENDVPERSGAIAEIVRPGYQYLISDEEKKIVRCAQVKLFD